MAEHENSIGESDEWYTPREVFSALGMDFDLDPCSPGSGHWVPARRQFTKTDDGLSRPWRGRVFMNPPFGGRNGHVPGASRAAIAEVKGKQAVTRQVKRGQVGPYKDTWQDARGRVYHRKDTSVRKPSARRQRAERAANDNASGSRKRA